MTHRRTLTAALTILSVVAVGCSDDADGTPTEPPADEVEVDGDDGNGALDGAGEDIVGDDGNGALDGAND